MRRLTQVRELIRGAAALVVALAALVLPATTAMAQAAPQPAVNPPHAWVGFVMMFLMLAVVVAISLMPSKRSHQD